jgi:hypothetical protein
MNCGKCNTQMFKCKKCGSVGCKKSGCSNEVTKSGTGNVCSKCGSTSGFDSVR